MDKKRIKGRGRWGERRNEEDREESGDTDREEGRAGQGRYWDVEKENCLPFDSPGYIPLRLLTSGNNGAAVYRCII